MYYIQTTAHQLKSSIHHANQISWARAHTSERAHRSSLDSMQRIWKNRNEESQNWMKIIHHTLAPIIWWSNARRLGDPFQLNEWEREIIMCSELFNRQFNCFALQLFYWMCGWRKLKEEMFTQTFFCHSVSDYDDGLLCVCVNVCCQSAYRCLYLCHS